MGNREMNAAGQTVPNKAAVHECAEKDVRALLADVAERIAARSRAMASVSAGQPLPDDLKAPLVDAEEALLLAQSGREHTLGLLHLGGLALTLLHPKGAASGFRCGIVNAKSGRCPEDCAFCAQSKFHHTDAPVHDLRDEETLEAAARKLAQAGAERFGIVTSGRGPSNKDVAMLGKALERMRTAVPIGFCASLGILTPDRARALADAGFTRYHHNLETGRSFFPKICSTHDYELDVETVRLAKTAGMSTCSGGLFGLGEGWRDRIELAMTVSGLDVDSIPINFLIAVKGTRLENQPPLDPMTALRIIAVMRLINPTRDIVICGGRNHVLGDRWETWVYAAGANGVMTGDYLTRPGNAMDEDRAAANRIGIEPMPEKQDESQRTTECL